MKEKLHRLKRCTSVKLFYTYAFGPIKDVSGASCYHLASGMVMLPDCNWYRSSIVMIGMSCEMQ